MSELGMGIETEGANIFTQNHVRHASTPSDSAPINALLVSVKVTCRQLARQVQLEAHFATTNTVCGLGATITVSET